MSISTNATNTMKAVEAEKRKTAAWRRLAMDLWNKRAKEACYDDEREEFADRIRALGGRP